VNNFSMIIKLIKTSSLDKIKNIMLKRINRMSQVKVAMIVKMKIKVRNKSRQRMCNRY